MLNKLSIIAKALAKIQEKRLFADDNGTNGKTYRCFVWDSEIVKDKRYYELEKERALAAFTGNNEEVYRLDKEIEKLETPTINFVFKLLQPEGIIPGTKIGEHNGKQYPLFARNVEFFTMAQDVMEGKYYEMKETGEWAESKSGEKTEVIDMTLTRCILDVAEAKYNLDGKMWRPQRVWATNVSFKALQVVGRMMRGEKQAISRLKGFMSEDEFKQLMSQQ